MKTKILFFVACSILISGQAYSLEGRYTFNPVNYGDGWYPWACVVYKGAAASGTKNGCGAGQCQMLPRIQGPNACAGDLSTSFTDPNKAYDSIYTLSARVTVPEDLKLITPTNSVVSKEACAGENIKAVMGASKGEWWDDGGNADSPPVFWVDDVETLAKSLTSRPANGNFFTTTQVPDGYVDPLTNIPVYSKNYLFAGQTSNWRGLVTGNVVCSLKQKPGTGLPADGYTPSGSETETEIDVTYIVECMFYYYSGGCTVKTSGFASGKEGTCLFNMPAVIEKSSYQSIEDLFKVGEISVKQTIKITKPAAPRVEVSVPASETIQANQRNVIKIDVANTGDVDIIVKDIDSASPHGFISCDAMTVKPGGTTECLMSIAPAPGEGVDAKVSYEYKYCGRTVKATAVETIVNSNAIMPQSVVQAYSIYVHGGCENQYYSCSPAASQGKFTVGYKCSKRQGAYFTPSVGRLDVTYDLSGVPANAGFGSARLVVTSAGVARAQELAVYSASTGLTPIACQPGGDICTKPYCQECQGLFDLQAEKVSAQMVSGPGKYYFDVSGLVKNAVLNGQKYISFQLRADEGTWDSEGSGSCNKDEEWNKLDIDLRGGGGDVPYLELLKS